MTETSPQSFARLAGLLLDIGSAENEEALLREGVSGARDVIGLDRVGIWKYDADAKMMLGTFGIDEAGGLRDERDAAYSIAPDSGDYPPEEVKEQLRDLVEESKRERKPAFRSLKGSLCDQIGLEVGRGHWVAVTLWGGRAVRGFLFCDNLLNHRTIDESQIGRLLVLCAAIGQNLDRIEALEALKRTSAELERQRNLSRSVIDAIGEVVCARDLEGRYLLVNEAWRRMDPHARNGGGEGTSLEAIFPPPLARERLARDRRIIETGEPMRDCFRGTFNQRKDRLIEINGYPVFDSSGGIFALAYVLRDITEETEQREALQQQKMIAERALRTKSNFIAAMNHDLRTPLNTIFSPLDFLLDTDLDEEQREMLMVAHESAQQLLCIVENILDMAKIEEQRIEARPESLRLREFLRDRLRPLENMATTRNLSFRIDVAADVPESVRTDGHLLVRILFNLVGNAVKFTRRGGVSVEVRSSGASLMIDVIDTGIGIPESEFDRLFKAFEQVESSGASKEGTGLGLAICKELSQSLGGSLTVRSREGEGSCFSLTLPA
ncbi:MAG: ATP-binding protein [Opitutales bacterium]